MTYEVLNNFSDYWFFYFFIFFFFYNLKKKKKKKKFLKSGKDIIELGAGYSAFCTLFLAKYYC